MDIRVPIACSIAILLAGCAEDRVTLVTTTGFDISADAAKSSANIGYERSEWIIGPTFIADGGGVAPMVASVGQQGGFFSPEVSQMAAMGQAAINITEPEGTESPPSTDSCSKNIACKGDAHRQYFGTRTVLGFNVSFKSPDTTAAVLGYRRTEYFNFPVRNCAPHNNKGAVQPEQQDPSDDCKARFPSALAAFYFKGKGDPGATPGSQLGQFFATGIAAEQLAGNSEMKKRFVGALASMAGNAKLTEKTKATGDVEGQSGSAVDQQASTIPAGLQDATKPQ